ncbi:hypothetical protein GNP80_08900 [Aliivibrio fischeri]|uniref:hypothetical protein n=1 Tax=Aliivibrio fischeri TaxID=668 RepID=UPI0012D87E9D|nr:hypothetical protein [Aliivibrio fischeri]MUK92559.1 hypothetical protein [Aliivibrio fischeri]
MNVVQTKQFKGQVFLKYLWQHSLYQLEGNQVSPQLAEDLKTTALSMDLIPHDKQIDPSDIFYWINYNVIPRWVRLSAFKLALQREWKPVDVMDVLTLLYLKNNKLTEQKILKLAKEYKTVYNVSISSVLIESAKGVIKAKKEM